MTIYTDLALVILSLIASVASEDYCLGDVFEPQCGDAEVIMVVNASYGRMAVGTCLQAAETGLGIGCHADVTDIIGKKCAGRRECTVHTGDPAILSLRPCGRSLHYLQIFHECVPVISTGRDFCQPGDILQITSASSSYITSVVTHTSRCGSRQSPWLIEALPGQQIILNLIDFAASDDGNQDINTCLVYAQVNEPDMPQGTTICGGQEKQRIVYESIGHRLELKILSEEEDTFFMFNYTFVGCTNMVPLAGIVLTREGNVTDMKCEFGEQKTTAYCNGTGWVGAPPNCTLPPPVIEAETSSPAEEPEKPRKKETVTERPEKVEIVETELVSFDFSSVSWGMVLILVGIMTAGLVACVLIIGVVYLKKKSHEVQPPPVFAPRPMSESGYETCDFTVAHRPSSVYRGGYRTLPKDYTPMMNGGQPGYDPDVWERPLPPEPLVNV